MPMKPTSLELMAALDVLREKKRVVAEQEAHLAAVTAERDALKADNDAHVTVRDKVRAALGCEPHEGVSDAAKRVVSERDALAAQLAALKKRVADAPKARAFVRQDSGLQVDPPPWRSRLTGEHVRVALVRLEDGET